MPFGLEIHMAAAHDPKIAKQLQSAQGAQGGSGASSIGGKRRRGKRTRGKQSHQKSSKPRRRPKHF